MTAGTARRRVKGPPIIPDRRPFSGLTRAGLANRPWTAACRAGGALQCRPIPFGRSDCCTPRYGCLAPESMVAAPEGHC